MSKNLGKGIIKGIQESTVGYILSNLKYVIEGIENQRKKDKSKESISKKIIELSHARLYLDTISGNLEKEYYHTERERITERINSLLDLLEAIK
jgi:hypothetical protein